MFFSSGAGRGYIETVVNRLSALGEKKWLLLLALIAILVRIPWAIAMSDRSLQFDEGFYSNHAEQLCAGNGYVDQRGVEDDYWPVGYPALLALAYCTFGVTNGVGFGLQVFLLSLTCVVISSIGERSFGPGVGRAGALLLALYPNYVFYSSLLLTEPLFTLLLVCLTALLLAGQRSEWGYVAYASGVGVLAGLATLVRPGFLLLPVLVLFWCLVQKMPLQRGALTALVVALACLATVSPWMVRNHGVTQPRYEISSNGGLVFWGGNHPEALGGVERPAAVERDLGFGTAYYDGALGYQLGIEAIASDLPAALRRSVQKISYFFAIETDGAMWSHKGLEGAGKGTLPVVLASLAYIAGISTAVFSLLHGLRNRAFGSWFLILSGYSVGVAAVFEGDPRYHFPLVPFLLMYSALGVFKDIPLQMKAFEVEGYAIFRSRIFLGWMTIMTIFLLLIILHLFLKTIEEARSIAIVSGSG